MEEFFNFLFWQFTFENPTSHDLKQIARSNPISYFGLFGLNFCFCGQTYASYFYEQMACCYVMQVFMPEIQQDEKHCWQEDDQQRE